MSKINQPAMEVIQGEMYIFGEKLSRHPEFPWLFSATALHKSCEEAIKLRAKKDGKDPEKFFTAKRPGEWIRFNILAPTNKERVEHYANHTRTRIKKYGPNLGFGMKKSDGRFLPSQIDSLTDLQVVCVTAKGNSSKVLQGSYLCQLAIVKYIETFSEKFRATVQNSFISMVNGEVETVTDQIEKARAIAKGSKELERCKEAGVILQEACAEKKIRNGIKVQEGINEGILGMPGEKYRKLNGLQKPLNDNLSLSQIHQKLHANLFAADSIKEDSRAVIPAVESKVFGLRAGLRAKIVCADADLRKLLDQRVAAEEKLYLSKIAQANARFMVKKTR